ncbi:MAG TPA: HAMP domain-containing sensor histidine kinase [Pirellulales bacterium]|nr:HAMP domain-containing sensor histidine kinase [Pirellulales bacterium]
MSGRSIQQRFLLPVVAVVAVALTVSAAITAAWLHHTVQQRDQQRLARVVAALTAPGFPLNEPVLAKMSGLSGAEFVVLDARQRPVAASLQLDETSLDGLLVALAEQNGPGDAVAAVTLGERPYLAEAIALVPRWDEGGRRLVVLSPADPFWTSTGGIVLPPLVVGLVACVLLVGLVSAIARHTARPIEQLAAHAVRIASGDFSQCATRPGCRELDDLAAAMNDMAGRLREYADRIRRNERLRTLDQLSGGIAHQLRNAATGARLALDLYRRDAGEPDCEPLAVADRQLHQIEAYCQRFLSLARGTQPREPRSFVCLVLDDVVRESCSMVAPLARHAGTTIDCLAADGPLEMLGDAETLRQVLINLLVNAVEAVRHPDVIDKKVAIVVRRSGENLVVRVGDTGPGPSSLVGDVFEPLVSDKAEGTGLGLAVAREVIAAHGGRVHWQREGGWTWFEVHLPTAQVGEMSKPPVANAPGSPAFA